MPKILLGILIGLGITFTGVALADYTGQHWGIPSLEQRGQMVYKLRDGRVICYVSTIRVDGGNGDRVSNGISCLLEPR